LINKDTVVTSPDNILFTQLEDEIIILDINKGKYFSLNSTGADIFRRFVDGATFGEVLEEMKIRYPDTEEKQLEKDIRDIMLDLKKSEVFKF